MRTGACGRAQSPHLKNDTVMPGFWPHGTPQISSLLPQNPSTGRSNPETEGKRRTSPPARSTCRLGALQGEDRSLSTINRHHSSPAERCQATKGSTRNSRNGPATAKCWLARLQEQDEQAHRHDTPKHRVRKVFTERRTHTLTLL